MEILERERERERKRELSMNSHVCRGNTKQKRRKEYSPEIQFE